MKVSKLSVLFTIAILATSTSVISVNAAGRTSASIPNTILNGKGAPASTVGINGDFYIDTRSLLIYGPKAKSKWPLPQNLQGPTGASGTSGATGTDGKNGTDGKVSTATATTGATGATGSPGAPGAQGTPGATGATGASGSGSPGATGATGSPGSNGSPGLAGAKGETGTAGADGPSEVRVIEIIPFAISTMTPLGETSSSSFGDLAINSSYFFHIFISGESLDDFYDFAARISASSGSPTFNFFASRSKLVADATKRIAYGVSIVGTIKTSGATSNLSINLIDITGESGTRGGVTFSGRMFLQKVGTII